MSNTDTGTTGRSLRVGLAADHGGFRVKEALRAALQTDHFSMPASAVRNGFTGAWPKLTP